MKPADVEGGTQSHEAAHHPSNRCAGDLLPRVPAEGLTPEQADSHRAGTAERNATMLHVSFHNFTAMVGAGVLALPSMMAALGWAGGTVALVLSWAISFVTFMFLVKLHDIDGTDRMDRYPKLTTHAFGPRAGVWLLTPFQVAQFVGLPIAYTITGATSLQNIVALLAPASPWGGHGGGLSRWVVVFSAVQLAVVQVRSFAQLSYVSLVGAAGSLFYITVSFVGALVRGRARGTVYGPPAGWGSTSDRVFGTFNALATAAFAYGGHNIACEIQGTLPAPPPTLPRMQLSVVITFVLTAVCYFGVAVTGYWAFGAAVADNILTSLSRPVGVIVAANAAVFFHVLASYHVFLFPLIDMFDGAALRRGILPSSLAWRLLLRSACVVAIGVVACAVPFFGTVLGFVGALCITPTTFLMPAALWLKLRAPSWRRWDFWFCVATLAMMGCVMVVGAAGALRDLERQVFHPANGERPPSFQW